MGLSSQKIVEIRLLFDKRGVPYPIRPILDESKANCTRYASMSRLDIKKLSFGIIQQVEKQTTFSKEQAGKFRIPFQNGLHR